VSTRASNVGETEFYRERRHRIVDGAALIGFLVGFLGSAPLAWMRLSTDWVAGAITRSLAIFIATTLGAGVLLGLVASLVGRVVANRWIRKHAKTRMYEEDRPASAEISSGNADRVFLDVHVGVVDGAAYHDLLQRCGVATGDLAAFDSALRTTINVSVHMGDRVVGLARIFSDGVRCVAVVEEIADPAHPWVRGQLRAAARQQQRSLLADGAMHEG